MLRRGSLIVMLGIFAMSFCGSALGAHIGLLGLAQWPLAGFALGLVLVGTGTTLSMFRLLSDRVSELEVRFGVASERMN